MESSKKGTKRIEHLDFLKFFAIFCVVLGHSVQYISGKKFCEHPVWEFIYSFHMPLFMMISGYFFDSSLRIGFGSLLKKKFVQLMIPYFSAAITFTIIWTLENQPSSKEFLSHFILYLRDSLWFLKSLFLCFVAGFVFMKMFRNVWLAAIISIFIVNIAPKMVANVHFLLPMFWVGYLCKIYQDFILKHHTALLTVSMITFILLMSKWSGYYTIYRTPIHIVDWKSLCIDKHNFLITGFRSLIGLSGSMTFFLLSPFVWEKIKGTKVADCIIRIGESTLGIYWFQSITLEMFFSRIGLCLSFKMSSLTAPLLAIAELFLCYYLITLTRRTHWLRVLILGEANSLKVAG